MLKKWFYLLLLCFCSLSVFGESKYESHISRQIRLGIKETVEENLEYGILTQPGYSATLSIQNGWKKISNDLFFGVFDYKLTFYIAEKKASLFFPYQTKIIQKLRKVQLDDGSFNGGYVYLGRAYFRSLKGKLSMVTSYDFKRLRGQILAPQQIAELNKEEEKTADDIVEEVNGTPLSGLQIKTIMIPEYKKVRVENFRVFLEGASLEGKIQNNLRFKIRLSGLFKIENDTGKITLRPIFKEPKTGIVRPDIVITDIKRIQNIEKIDKYGSEYIRFKTNKPFDFVVYAEALKTFKQNEKLELTVSVWSNGVSLDPILVDLPVEQKSYWFVFLLLFIMGFGLIALFYHYKTKDFNHTKYIFQLILENGELEGKTFTLSGSSHVVGRIQKNKYSIKLDSDKVSRKHATIKRVNKGYSITDESSTNGTFVNGSKVKANKTQFLQHNDRVRIGDVDFRMSIVKK
ncbi:MAG: FHA domain-containing protein [Leptospiraceae bacterium]|nr:FHA domain-containing protein [Leptospiraceae bacterium]MCP5494795.1 FHA domain-containing protein [Leptospiraceae bacterium]